MTRERIRAQKGMTLVLAALLLFAFLAIAAICIDLGILYSARTSAQHAADAGALAGAQTFLSPTATATTAQTRAVAVANANKILGSSVAITSSDVVVDTTLRRVTVTVTRSGDSAINTFFAKALGLSSVPVQARATAEASASATGTNCVKPVFLPNTIMSSLGPAGCTSTPKQILFDPANPGQLSPWAQNAAGNFNFTGTCFGARPIQSSQALAPSQFYSLDFGSGANTYNDVWGQCLNEVPGATPQPVNCGTTIPLETGNMVGPTRQGVANFTGTPADLWIASPPASPDEASPNFYQPGNGGSPITTSRSLAVVPIYDNCSAPGSLIGPGCSGTCAVTVIGFLQIFVDGMGTTPSCSLSSGGQYVIVHAVNATACTATGGGGSGSGGTGPLAVPIRLINP